MLQFLHVHISDRYFWKLYWIGSSLQRFSSMISCQGWLLNSGRLRSLGGRHRSSTRRRFRLAPLNQERWLGQDLRVDPSSLDVPRAVHKKSLAVLSLLGTPHTPAATSTRGQSKAHPLTQPVTFASRLPLRSRLALSRDSSMSGKRSATQLWGSWCSRCPPKNVLAFLSIVYKNII